MGRFWETKSLAELSTSEWESLCDGCGLCCRLKLETEDGDIAVTNVVCRYLETEQCHCGVYPERQEKVPECMVLSVENLDECYFAPPSCAYRLLYEGKRLPDWHPLLTGSRHAMEAAGIPVTGKVFSEEAIHPSQIESHIVEWVD